MSQQVVHDENNEQAFSRAGRTLLLDASNPNFDSKGLKKMKGIKKSFYSERSSSWFLEFDTRVNSVSAFENLSSNDRCRVKYCNYDIFVKYKNIDNNDVDFEALGNKHKKWVEEQTGATVLRYKPYKKGEKYLGCGQITIDLKDAFDTLLASDGLRDFTFEGISGTHYRYNNKRRNQQNDQMQNKTFASVTSQ
jgi:hypothetical protein